MSRSYLERITEGLIKQEGIREPIREFRFTEERRWRCDFVWVPEKVILEVEGGTWMKKGGHTTGTGFQNNCEKYNEATLLGFKVLRVTKIHLISGQAMKWVKQALDMYGST
jgi:very-short-patch-repair endonuclease